MKVFVLLSLFALNLANASIPSYLSHCKNNFVLNFIDLKGKMSYGDDSLYLLWDAYGGGPWKNTGIIERILQEYYGGDGHGCEMLKATLVEVLGTKYRIFVGNGNGDCDGGNYYGVVLDWSKIEKRLDAGPPEKKSHFVKDIVVAEIGDGEIYCASSTDVDAFFNKVAFHTY